MTIKKFLKDVREQDSKLDVKLSERLNSLGCKKINSLSELSETVFNLWKYQKKLSEKQMEDSLDDTLSALEDKIIDNKLMEIVEGDRKLMIRLAERIAEKHPYVIIIFVNSDGDIIAKSDKTEVKGEFDKILEKCNGSGGGRPYFCQGKMKFLRLPDDFRLNNRYRHYYHLIVLRTVRVLNLYRCLFVVFRLFL